MRMCCDRYPHHSRRRPSIPLILLFVCWFGGPLHHVHAQSPDALLDSARSLLARNPGQAVRIAERAFGVAVNDDQQADAMQLSGSAWQQLGQNAKAAKSFRKGIAIANRSSNAILSALMLNGLGAVHRRMGFLDLSLNDHLQALTLFDSLRDGSGSAKSMHEIAVTLRNLGRSDEARVYHDRALVIRTALDDRRGIAESMCGIGNLYYYAGRLDSAEYYYRKALETVREVDLIATGISGYLNNLGNVYRDRGLFREARSAYDESLRHSHLLGDNNMRAVTLKNLGILDTRTGNFRQGEARLRQAARLAREGGLARVLTESLNAIATLYEQEGDFRSALLAKDAAHSVQDSLASMLNMERIANAEALYQTEKHRRAMRELEAERQMYLARFLFVSAILLIVIVVGVLLMFRLLRKRNIELAGRTERAEDMHAQLEQMHQQVARSEEQYRLLFDGLPVGVFFYDASLRILRANQAFADILGLAHDECMRFNLGELKSIRVVDALQNGLEQEHGIYEGEFLLPGTGETIMVALRTAPMRIDSTGASGVVGFLLDISDWKQVERELTGAKETAEKAVRLKQAFLISISHEIRTPLNVIMGYVSVLHAALVDRISSSELEHFEKIDLAVRRLARTVDQLLSLSILESGSYALEPEYVSISTLVEQLVDETRALAEEKGLTVQLRTAGREVFIHADKYSVSQALRNLLDNAVKFTHKGEIIVTVSTRDPDVVISIADTGIGISESYLQQLYVAFTQENVGYTPPYDRLRLGLTLTKRYVDANGGGIAVKSTKGLGSTFSMAFLEAVGRPIVELQEPVKMLSGDMSNVVLLVVEDDPETQKFLNLVLSQDYTMYFADSADDAWTLLHERSYDVVLMDISLRGEEDGLSLTRRIRADAAIAKTPVIAVTAHAFTEDKRRSFAAGCDDYLAKPFRTQILRERIERQLMRIHHSS